MSDEQKAPTVEEARDAALERLVSLCENSTQGETITRAAEIILNYHYRMADLEAVKRDFRINRGN